MTPTELHNKAFLTPMPTLQQQLDRLEKNNMSAYIIWNPASKLPPTVTHSSRPEAIRVAGRMAAQNPGESFYVCKLTNKAFQPKVVAVQYDDLEKADEACPF